MVLSGVHIEVIRKTSEGVVCEEGVACIECKGDDVILKKNQEGQWKLKTN